MRVEEILEKRALLAEVVNEKKLFAPKINRVLAKNALMLEKEAKSYTENMGKIVEKYALKNKDGKPEEKNGRYVFPTKEAEKQYKEAMKELLELEVEIELEKVKAEELEKQDKKYDEPTAADWIALDCMLEN